MTLADRIEELRTHLRRRKHLRDRKRGLRQGSRARREARAVRRLRALINRLLAPRVQYDAVTVGNIPADPPAVAGYVNGHFANMDDMRRQFPDARHTSIAVSSDTLADCLDVEPGDATAADCPGWYKRYKKRWPHRKPIFYTFAGGSQDMIDALHNAGIPRDKYILWSAHWDGKHICGPHTCGFPKADATQWTTHGETYDETKCRPSYWDRTV